MANANLFQLSGSGIHVSYSTTSIVGKPHFTFQDAHGAHSFSGDSIQAMETPIGTLVTVVLRLTPDAGSTTFSVLIPRVTLHEKLPSTHVRTECITTVHRSSIAPETLQGQLDLYTVHALHGTASAVFF